MFFVSSILFLLKICFHRFRYQYAAFQIKSLGFVCAYPFDSAGKGAYYIVTSHARYIQREVLEDELFAGAVVRYTAARLIEVKIAVAIIGTESFGCRGKGLFIHFNQRIQNVVCSEADFHIVAVVEEVLHNNGVFLLRDR